MSSGWEEVVRRRPALDDNGKINWDVLEGILQQLIWQPFGELSQHCLGPVVVAL